MNWSLESLLSPSTCLPYLFQETELGSLSLNMWLLPGYESPQMFRNPKQLGGFLKGNGVFLKQYLIQLMAWKVSSL